MSKEKKEQRIVVRAVPIDSLILDTGNPRKHSRRSIDEIKKSLEHFGQQKPILVSNNIIISGNGTYQAAKELGWPEILVTDTNLPPDALKAYSVTDNRSGELSKWNFDETQKVYQALKVEGFDAKVTALDPDRMLSKSSSEKEPKEPDPDKPQMVVLSVTEEQEEKITAAISELSSEGSSDGAALAEICAEYIRRHNED